MAHAVTDRARKEVALVNECRVNVAIRLREAHHAIGEQHKLRFASARNAILEQLPSWE